MSARALAQQVTRAGALALAITAFGALAAGFAWGRAANGGIAALVRHAPELIAPVVALLLLAAPLGALAAAEIAALRDGGQLAWLRLSGRSALRDVVAPRVAAAALVAPLAALVAAFAMLAATAPAIAREQAAVATLASITPGRLASGAMRAIGGGAALAAAACAAGLLSQVSVGRSAARGAAVALATASALGLAWLARGAT